MKQPDPDKAPKPPPHKGGQTLTHIHSLKSCPGWKDWLLPKLQKDRDEAEKQVKEAAKKFQPIPMEAAATLKVLEDLVLQYIDTEETRALAQINNPRRDA